eukprot:m.231658 g.231658  ORF g.231658 m.231658 type:complete len:103 (-) comp111747_c0_seq1:203-511(-)
MLQKAECKRYEVQFSLFHFFDKDMTCCAFFSSLRSSSSLSGQCTCIQRSSVGLHPMLVSAKGQPSRPKCCTMSRKYSVNDGARKCQQPVRSDTHTLDAVRSR